MYLFLVLAVVTMVELLLLARMDLKERKVYSFPILMMSLSWLSYLLSTGEYKWQFLLSFAALNMSVWFLFNRFKLWGAGDSDMFLVLSNILLAVVGPCRGSKILFLESIALIVVMLSAMFFGYIESKVKKEKLNLHSQVAVVPGFAFVICGLLVMGVFGRIS